MLVSLKSILASQSARSEKAPTIDCFVLNVFLGPQKFMSIPRTSAGLSSTKKPS
jgi:hypothetical protein